MASRGDGGDPARDLDGEEDPARLLRWLRLAADVLERNGKGGGKKGGEHMEDEEREGKSPT